MIDVLLATDVVLAAGSGGEDSPVWLLLLGPAGAVGVYWMLFRFYRNTDKSHGFERETLVEAEPVTGEDRLIDKIRGTTERWVRGRNERDYRERVDRLE